MDEMSISCTWLEVRVVTWNELVTVLVFWPSAFCATEKLKLQVRVWLIPGISISFAVRPVGLALAGRIQSKRASCWFVASQLPMLCREVPTDGITHISFCEVGSVVVVVVVAGAASASGAGAARRQETSARTSGKNGFVREH